MCSKRLIGNILQCWAAIIIIVLSGCTILEDRGECLGTVVIDLSEARSCHGLDSSLGLCLRTDDTVIIRTFPASEIPDIYSEQLTGKICEVSVFTPGDILGYGGIHIETGKECPPVWADYHCVKLGKETSAYKAKLHKNHCCLTLRFVNGLSSNMTSYTVCGNISGYKSDFSLMEGDFTFKSGIGYEGQSTVVLPRQKDGSLLLEIRSFDNAVKTFALGSFLEEIGYDWNDVDLEDVAVDVDFQSSSVVIRIGMWERYYHISEVI